MKNLIYSSALLCVILFTASCTKTDLSPSKNVSVPGPSNCAATAAINYVLTNSTGDGSYEIAFSGSNNYTFNFPASGSTTVSVKPGTYSIFIYSPGNNTDRNFYWGNQQVINEAGARWDGVTITPCTVPQSVTITQ